MDLISEQIRTCGIDTQRHMEEARRTRNEYQLGMANVRLRHVNRDFIPCAGCRRIYRSQINYIDTPTQRDTTVGGSNYWHDVCYQEYVTQINSTPYLQN